MNTSCIALKGRLSLINSLLFERKPPQEQCLEHTVPKNTSKWPWVQNDIPIGHFVLFKCSSQTKLQCGCSSQTEPQKHCTAPGAENQDTCSRLTRSYPSNKSDGFSHGRKLPHVASRLVTCSCAAFCCSSCCSRRLSASSASFCSRSLRACAALSSCTHARLATPTLINTKTRL